MVVAVVAFAGKAAPRPRQCPRLWRAARSAGDLRLPALLPELEPYSRHLIRELEATERAPRRIASTSARWRILLYRFEPTAARGQYLRALLAAAGPDRVEIIRDSLASHPDQAATEEIWQRLGDDSAEPASDSARRPPWRGSIRAAPLVRRWACRRPRLLNEDRRTIPRWVELLEPVLPVVIPKLTEDVRDPRLSSATRAASAEALAEALGRLGLIAEFADPIADADTEAFHALLRMTPGACRLPPPQSTP